MRRNPDIAVVTTTVDREDTARTLARAIVDARLAACVQCVPIHSTYRWKGAVEEAAEFLLLAKTQSARVEDLTRFLRDHHTYELPEIAVLPVRDGLPEYLKWVRDETAVRRKKSTAGRS